MLTDDDAYIIEGSAATTHDAELLRLWVAELLRDRRERIAAADRVRQRLKPFAYFRDVLERG